MQCPYNRKIAGDGCKKGCVVDQLGHPVQLDDIGSQVGHIDLGVGKYLWAAKHFQARWSASQSVFEF